MVGAPPAVPVNFNERAKRTPDDQVRERYAPQDPNAPGRGGRGGGPFGGGRGGRGAQTPPPEGHLSAQQVNQRITAVPARQPAGAASHSRRVPDAFPA